MRSFLEDCSLQKIKIKLSLLYSLNVTDLIFTYMLLSTGLYREANIVMAMAMESMAITLLLKIVLPALLFITVSIRIKQATNKQLKISNNIINAVTAFYLLINLFHFISFTILPILQINL